MKRRPSVEHKGRGKRQTKPSRPPREPRRRRPSPRPRPSRRRPSCRPKALTPDVLSPVGGRQSVWETVIQPHLDKVREMAAKGATDSEICRALKIGRTAFYAHLRSQEEFSDAIEAGREPATDEIEASLFNLAKGGDVRIVRIEEEQGKIVKRVQTIRPLMCNLGAARYWLDNRRPERWRSKVELSAGGPVEPYTDNLPEPDPPPAGLRDEENQPLLASPEAARSAR